MIAVSLMLSPISVYTEISDGTAPVSRAPPGFFGLLEQDRRHREVLERALGAGADVRDDLGSAQAAEAAADVERTAVGDAVEKAAGIEIAGAGGVDDLCHRCGRDLMAGGAGDHDRALGAAGQHGNLAVARGGASRSLEIAGLVERVDLDLVREHDIDMVRDQRAE